MIRAKSLRKDWPGMQLFGFFFTIDVLSLGYVFINRKNNRGILFAWTEFIL